MASASHSKRPLLGGTPDAKRLAAGQGSSPLGGLMGEVRFRDPATALPKALEMDGSVWESNVIAVELDSSSKDNSKVIVGNIPRNVEWQELKDHFKPCGDVAFANVKGSANSVSVGEIRYATQEEATQAIAMFNGAVFKGSTIEVKHHFASKDNTKLQVLGVPGGVEWQELKDYFGSAGNVVHSDVITSDGNLTRSADVRYSTEEEAMQAIAMFNGSDFMGSTIQVKQHYASKDNTKVQVFGVPGGAEWQDVKDFFGSAGNVVFCDVSASGLAAEGEIRYEDPNHAQLAVQSLNGSLLGGAAIKVKLDPRSQDRTKLIVSGIPTGMDWQQLKDHFKDIGKVAHAEVNTKGSGNGQPGFGKGVGKSNGNLVSMVAQMLNNAMWTGGGTAFGGGKGLAGVMGSGAGVGFGGAKGMNLSFGGAKGKNPTLQTMSLVGEVRYDDPECAMLAINLLNGSNFNGAQLKVGLDYSSQDGTKLWVGNVPPGTGWQDLKDYFAQIARVAFVNLRPSAKWKGEASSF